jgi:hypothetical protein
MNPKVGADMTKKMVVKSRKEKKLFSNLLQEILISQKFDNSYEM